MNRIIPFVLVSLFSNCAVADILGCGTLVKSEPINQRPEYASNTLGNYRTATGKIASGVGDPSILSAAAQGGIIGLVAAAAVAIGAGVVEAVSQKSPAEVKQEGEEMKKAAEQEQKWE